MSQKSVLKIRPLGFQWETADPFLFCAHHLDYYPPGNPELEPAASLEGRRIGNDFEVKDGWRMYHGTRVPGFPVHPHRGFETVTIVLNGYVDHSDSMGAGGRYGEGDVQWMTAGSGIQHAEMFPLLDQEKGNRLELLQIWLNLPKANKFAEPVYKMFWNEMIPFVPAIDKGGKSTRIKVIAGELNQQKGLVPPPGSWAANPENRLNIWLIEMDSEATWTLPANLPGINRRLYFFHGDSLKLDADWIESYQVAHLNPEKEIELRNGNTLSFLLLLDGKPILEPVARYGPFVMNTETEIRQAFSDYQLTWFGGWPWTRNDPVYPAEKGRFARFSDGREENP